MAAILLVIDTISLATNMADVSLMLYFSTTSCIQYTSGLVHQGSHDGDLRRGWCSAEGWLLHGWIYQK